MNVLSLFDGMSCCQIALDRLGIDVENYYAAEIDKYAIKVTQANYPDTFQLGDVSQWRDWHIDWSSIDLVTGGFPCQAWSMAGQQLGDKDERGMLFWTMLDIMQTVLHHNNKAKFLIENVKMKREFEQYITLHTEKALGSVKKHLINSALVSAQNRERYYWTNIEGIEQPESEDIMLSDVIGDSVLVHNIYGGFKETKPRVFTEKSPTLRANSGGGAIPSVAKKDDEITFETAKHFRLLSPAECERLQTVPEGYTAHVSNTQRYKMLGNGWTVDVITHILSYANFE